MHIDWDPSRRTRAQDKHEYPFSLSYININFLIPISVKKIQDTSNRFAGRNSEQQKKLMAMPYNQSMVTAEFLEFFNKDAELEREQDAFWRFENLVSGDGQTFDVGHKLLANNLSHENVDEAVQYNCSLQELHNIANERNPGLLMEDDQQFAAYSLSFDDVFFTAYDDSKRTYSFSDHLTVSPLEISSSKTIHENEAEIIHFSMAEPNSGNANQIFPYEESPYQLGQRADSRPCGFASLYSEHESNNGLPLYVRENLYDDSSKTSRPQTEKANRETQNSRQRPISSYSTVIPSPAMSPGKQSDCCSVIEPAIVTTDLATPEADYVETKYGKLAFEGGFGPKVLAEVASASKEKLDSAGDGLDFKGILAFESPNRKFSMKFFDHILSTRELTGKTINYLKRKQVGKKCKLASGKDKNERALREWRNKPFRCRFANCIMSHIGLGRGPLLAAHIAAGHLEVQSLTCHACNRDFSRTDALRRHNRVVHHDRESSKELEAPQDDFWTSIHTLLCRAATEAIELGPIST